MVKTSERLVGIVVLRSMSLVITPPLVSMPRRQRGHVEQQDVLDLALEHAGLQAGAEATTSSGLTPLLGSLPPVSSLTSSTTAGMRVEPPTSTT